MRIKWGILLLLNFAPNSLFAQIQNKKIQFGFNIGVAFPLRDLAKKDLSLPTSSFTGPGPSIDLRFSQRIGKHLGWTTMIQANLFLSDHNALKNQMSAAYPGYSKVSILYANNPVSNQYLGGLFYTFALNPKKTICIDSKAMAGFAWYVFEGMHITASSQNGYKQVSLHKHAAVPISLIYKASASLRFNKGYFISYVVNVDYTRANIHFHNVQTDYSYFDASFGRFDDNYSYSIKESYTMSFAAWNITAGILFRFKK